MNLVRAELGRLAARRFVRLMLVLLIVAFSITIATTLAGSHRPTPGELARAEQMAEQQRRDSAAEYERCLARVRSGVPQGVGAPGPPNCEYARPDRIDPSDYLYGVFVFERQLRPSTYFLVAFLALFGFLVGASYLGAELASGGMTNLLLWRPQRTVVLGTKLGTLLAGVLGVSVVASALYLGAFWTIAQVGGLPGQLDGEFWGWLWLTVGRGLALTLMVTALGFAIAALGRHTAAALGAVAAYGVVWELGGRIVMEIIDTPRPDQWMLSTYLSAWMTGEVRLWDRSACRGQFIDHCDGSYTLTWVAGLIVLLAVVGGCVAAAFTTFRRRDLV